MYLKVLSRVQYNELMNFIYFLSRKYYSNQIEKLISLLSQTFIDNTNNNFIRPYGGKI